MRPSPQVSDVLVHDLVPARFDCPRGVFLVNQGRWFKHMHDRDGGSVRRLYGGGFNASGQGVGCLAGREGELLRLRDGA